MQRCLKCGRENADGMRFCTNCGAPLAGEASTPDSEATVLATSNAETISFNATPQTSPGGRWPTAGVTFGTQTPPPFAPPERKRSGMVIGIIAAVLLLGIIGIGGIGAWYYYSKSDTEVANNGGLGLGGDSKNKNGSPSPKPSPSASPESKQLFEPPTVPTKEGTFTVYANAGWQMSNIAVVPLEEFTTTVDGIVDISGVKVGLRANGINDAQFKSRRLVPEFPTGALLMRTRYADGRYSNMVAAKTSGNWQNLPDERGMLEFVINDNAPQNNGGQFTIRVKLTNVPKK